MTRSQHSFFQNHKDAAELHFTSDKMPFFRKADAEAHAAGLDDKTVTTVHRSEDIEPDGEPTPEPDPKQDETDEQRIAREEAEAAEKKRLADEKRAAGLAKARETRAANLAAKQEAPGDKSQDTPTEDNPQGGQ